MWKAMNAAARIGNDDAARQSGAPWCLTASPGNSAQRQRWFHTGFEARLGAGLRRFLLAACKSRAGLRGGRGGTALILDEIRR